MGAYYVQRYMGQVSRTDHHYIHTTGTRELCAQINGDGFSGNKLTTVMPVLAVCGVPLLVPLASQPIIPGITLGRWVSLSPPPYVDVDSSLVLLYRARACVYYSYTMCSCVAAVKREDR